MHYPQKVLIFCDYLIETLNFCCQKNSFLSPLRIVGLKKTTDFCTSYFASLQFTLYIPTVCVQWNWNCCIFSFFFMETKKNLFFTSWRNISVRKVTNAKQSFRRQISYIYFWLFFAMKLSYKERFLISVICWCFRNSLLHQLTFFTITTYVNCKMKSQTY